MKSHLEKKHYYYLVFILFIYGIWSFIQPFDAGPDEKMRYDICQFILNHRTLPHGGDPEIRNVLWGQSYAFTPILAYMLCAIPMKLVSLLTSDAHLLLMSARLVNVLLGVGTIYFVIKIALKLFKEKHWQWLFIMGVSCLPQFAFIFTYVNNDGLALFSCAMIVYYWIKGLEDRWSYTTCSYLAIAIGICMLSYYNSYGFILVSVFLFIGSMIYFHKKDFFKPTLTKGLYITFIVVIIAGWWFVRNYIIYDGDILGMKTSNYYAELYADPDLKPSMILTPEKQKLGLRGMLFNANWLSEVVLSFIARFGYMSIYPPQWMYYIFTLIAGLGCIGVIKDFFRLFFKEGTLYKMFNWSMAVAFIIPNLLNMYYSYFNDFQPQGRYSMPMIIPFVYFITIGTKKLFERFKWDKHYVMMACSGCAFCLIYSLFFMIIPHYY